MASIESMQSAFNSLVSSEATVSIPGLDFDLVVDGYIRNKFKKQISDLGEEGETLVANMKEYYNGDGKQEMLNKISDLKMNVSALADGITNLTTTVTTMTTQALIPSVLTVGSATSTANPAYVLLENKNKVGMLKSLLKNLSISVSSVLKSAIDLNFELPDSVMLIISSIASLKEIVNKIPV